MAQKIPQDGGRNTRPANSSIKVALHWYTKLFAVWIVLFAAVGYFWHQPFVFLATHKMFGTVADSWPEVFQPLRSPNLWFFALTMFGIGAVLTVADFENIAKRPVIVLIGTLAQFTIMPLGAFALSKLFGLPPMLAAGLIIAVVVLLNACGMASGYGVGSFFKMPTKQRRTLAIEIGMQNAGLGTVLALNNLGPEAAIPTAFFVFACIITASIMTEIWKSRKEH
ncbi:MAG: hypothetical protein H8E62_00950 [Planctomycetes bacterium]|nr:hypothetical protein [Planctomycetota bacterium]